MKYRVPLKIIFDGCALIEADNEDEAEQKAIFNVGGVLGNVSDNCSDCVLDIELDTHGYTERRDNESIEEVDDD